MMDDTGAPLTISQMADLVGDLTGRMRLADGSIPVESWMLVDKAQIEGLNRVHGLLVNLAPHSARVRELVTPRGRAR